MINKYIDYIQDPNDTYQTYLEKAKTYNVRCIFAEEDQLEQTRAFLQDSDIIIAGAIDFPEGKMTLDEKLNEFKRYATLGYKEIDYVLNQENIENRNFDAILDELVQVAYFCKQHNIVDKAIVEMCKLDETSKEKVCQLANIAKPVFLKTSTGRSFGGATLEDVKLMRKTLDNQIQIKAAGGIRTYQDAKSFVEAGANALGASAAIAIIEGEK